MIDKKIIKKIVRGVTHKDRDQKNHNLMHPEREWFTGLGVSLIILSAGTFWCIHLYLQYSYSANTVSSDISTEQVVYRETEVNQALKEFSERKERHTRLKESLISTNINAELPQSEVFIPVQTENEGASSTSPETNLTETENSKSIEVPESDNSTPTPAPL